MKQNIKVERFSNSDLNMYQCGTENCEPGHDYGPAVRDHYLIHYILDGCGSYNVGDKTYKLGKGQGFLICPNVITYYSADFKKPWTYSWVGFNGLNAGHYLKRAGLTQDTPIFTYDRDDDLKLCLDEMITAGTSVKNRDLKLLGLLYQYLSLLVDSSGLDLYNGDEAGRQEFYVRKAAEYIEMNYSRNISISEMARYIGLDRSYLGALFKEMLNISPKEYLMSLRVRKACELMDNRSLSIGDIARSVGYEDQLLFSKVFKKIKSIPPSEYRRKSLTLDNGVHKP